ncbi:MAG: glycosyltransferase family 4 protein [Fibrobacter sp.]|nr:glycosyltransferase family 4 protein [Fibrobacter sp.]
MKKIVIVSGVFVPEPVTTALMNYDLALALSKKYDVTVIRPKPTRPVGKDYGIVDYNHYPFKCIQLDSFTYPESRIIGRMRESISFGKSCAAYIKAHKTDIDVVYNASWQLFGYKIVSKCCKKCGIPYVMPIQDIYPECLFTGKHYPKIIEEIAKSILSPLDLYSQKNAFKIRTISNEMADYMAETRKIPRENYLVIDNWQNDEDFSYNPLDEMKEKIVFGYVGSINDHSNTELIIQAFNEAKLPNSELRIYGAGNHKDACVALAKKLDATNVTFDVVDKKQVPYVQAETDVLVMALPTNNGGLCLPSKMISYLLSGRAVLASIEESATTRYMEEADCGLAVKPDSIPALVVGFTYFAQLSRNELQRLGKNSRVFAEKKLTRNSNLPLVIAALEDAMK